MRRIAQQHGLMLLIHEKPFAGINGSGKHNNWSMATDEGENLLDPGHDPHANAQFLAFLHGGHPGRQRARRPAASLHRGRRQRPSPGRQRGAARDHVRSSWARSSMDVVEQLEQGAASASKKGGSLDLGVTSLPDARRATRPTATGPRRSPSRATSSSSERSVSSAPIYWPQTVLNTAVADSLAQLADELEKLKPADFDGLGTILSGIVTAHKQVLFEGNNYSEEWHAEAATRGLPNNRTTVDALPALGDRQGEGAVREVRGPLRARARGPHRHQLGAIRQGQRHRGEHARSTSRAR